MEVGSPGHSLRFDVGRTGARGAGEEHGGERAVESIPRLHVSYVEALMAFPLPTAGLRTPVTTCVNITTEIGRDNNADGEIRMFRLAEMYLIRGSCPPVHRQPDAAINIGNGRSMSARDA